MAKKQTSPKKAPKTISKVAPKASKVAKTKEKPSKLAAIKNMIMGSAKGASVKAKPATKVSKVTSAPKTAAKMVKTVVTKTAPEKGATKALATKSLATTKVAAVKTTIPAKTGGSVKGKVAAVAVLDKTSLKVPPKVSGKKVKAAAIAAPAAAPALTRAPKVKRGRSAGPSVSRYDADNCREVACEGLSTTAGYCRMHYIKNWKKIKRKELILKEKKLNSYIEELVVKYPDKYIEAIRQDLANDKDFAKVIYDLDLDESVDDFDADGESVEQVIDSIKRDFDDEGDAF